MPPLAYGLNLPKKPAGSTPRKAGATPQKSILDGDDPDGEDNAKSREPKIVHDLESNLDLPQVPNASESKHKVKAQSKPEKQFQSLSSKHAAAAQELKSNDYDYDAVYDSLHAAKVHKSAKSGPQYMQQLLNAAEVRKRDQLRAKEAMLLREREAEGEEFADKEKFVTGAYKAQQEEVQRLEAEEREREKEDAERKRQGGAGMTIFYKGLIEGEEAKHRAAIKAVEDNAGCGAAVQDAEVKSESELAEETGAAVNDEGQIVDKRQTLHAGLNVKARPSSLSTKSDGRPIFQQSASMAILSGHGSTRTLVRERQSRMLEAQLEEVAKRAATTDETEKEALQKATKSRKLESEVLSAKERYLQRKKESEAAKLARKAPQ